MNKKMKKLSLYMMALLSMVLVSCDQDFFTEFLPQTNLPESQFASTANLARLARVKQLCQQTGTPPAVVPLGYLNSQPFFVSSVFAVTKLWQMEENMEAQDMVYDEKTLAFLDNRI